MAHRAPTLLSARLWVGPLAVVTNQHEPRAESDAHSSSYRPRAKVQPGPHRLQVSTGWGPTVCSGGEPRSLSVPAPGGAAFLVWGQRPGVGSCSTEAEEMKKEEKNLAPGARWGLDCRAPSLQDLSGPLAPHQSRSPRPWCLCSSFRTPVVSPHGC